MLAEKKQSNMKSLPTVDIGFIASAALKGIKDIKILQFRRDCQTFLVDLCNKPLHKCPLSYKVVKGASCLSPADMLNPSVRTYRITSALEVLLDKKQLSSVQADVVKMDYLGFDQSRKLLTTLSNTAVERSFSVNKECLVENLHEDSLIAQYVTYDAVTAAGGLVNVTACKMMIHADLRRDLQAVIGTRANFNIAQIENYGGETFLSEEVSIALLQESKLAFKRCQLLSRQSDLPGNAVQILESLLHYLMLEHVDYALDLGLHCVPIPETKTQPQIYFFDVVQQCNAIVHLLEKQFNDSLVPLVISTPKHGDCLQKKKYLLEQIEMKLDIGLDR
uniref:Exocyst complex component Sec10-like alpha-helical bundle domain-containing protein n=1 Tax=Timema genevievae TaxID=629358 RepID=A0A7R9K450_TIMGE|nr:unnamed protein product [Timema genevievae]